MANITRKSKDFTPEDRIRLLTQFKSSGLGYQEFAREHNINEQTMKNWVWYSTNSRANMKVYSPTERKKVVESYLASGLKKKDFCKTWGLSGSTLCDWQRRYEQFGSDGLMNKTMRKDDGRLGSKIQPAVRSEIIKLKRSEPSFGLKKMKHWLYRFRGVKVSTGSIRKAVKAEGLALAKKPKKKKRSSDRVRRFERARPMQLWQSDITQFTLGQYWSRVYLTVFMDDHSRYIVGWRLQSRQTADLVIDAFKDAVMRFGKPEEVLTDQGRQYFAWRGKSELEKILEKEGIKHVVSRAHHPQTLGKCERFWETVANEFWSRAKPQELEEARVRLKHFIDHYNHQRPHQGIDGHVPADRFFGVAEEVREVVERVVEQNALKMALGEIPKPPAFLIGQVGDQRIAFHGSSGSFYLTHESANGEQNGKSVGESSSEQSESIASGGVGENCKKAFTETSAPTGAVPSDPGSGVMEDGNGRGALASQSACASDNGILDGSVDEGGGNREAWTQADSILAVDGSSSGRPDSGSINPATVQSGSVCGTE